MIRGLGTRIDRAAAEFADVQTTAHDDRSSDRYAEPVPFTRGGAAR